EMDLTLLVGAGYAGPLCDRPERAPRGEPHPQRVVDRLPEHEVALAVVVDVDDLHLVALVGARVRQAAPARPGSEGGSGREIDCEGGRVGGAAEHEGGL